MSFIKKFKGKVSDNTGSKIIFRLYQIGLGIMIYLTIRFRKYIIDNWKQYLIYVGITVPLCLIWTAVLFKYDTFPPWLFWEHTLILGGIEVNWAGYKFVLEDILFYFFGQTLGFIFYISFIEKGIKFKNSFIMPNINFCMKEGKTGFSTLNQKIHYILNKQLIKTIWIILFGSFFFFLAIKFDYISLINFIFWAFPAIFLWFIAFDKIDLYVFIKYSIIMGLIVYAYDVTQTTFLPIIMHYLGELDAYQYSLWFYQFGGHHSKCYSDSFWLWGTEPIAMVLFFPYTGMLFQAGLMCCLKKLMKKE